MLRFEPNLMVNIHVSWAFPYKQRDVEIVGDKGVILIDCINQSIRFHPVNVETGPGFVSLAMSNQEAISINKKEPIIEECRSFIMAVKTNSAPFICPKQATQALSLALCNPV